MSDVTTQKALTPRVAEAVALWDALPADQKRPGGGGYETIRLQMNITEGRAAEYVRRGLLALGRGDESPRGSTTVTSQSGGGARPNAPVPDFAHQISELIQRNRHVAERLSTEVGDAEKADREFDPAAYIAAEIEAQTKALAEAQARLEAWQTDADGVATKAAEAEAKRLDERAKTLATSNDAQIETAIAAAEQGIDFLRAQGIEVSDEGTIAAADPAAVAPSGSDTPPEGDDEGGSDTPPPAE